MSKSDSVLSTARTASAPSIVGGGPKKVLYTLQTVGRIGLLNSAKALKSHNACKACGLGMGGQHGGMTNEMDEFPSVCNKSIQAQSTDIQPPIPEAVFQHTLEDFQQLSRYELEHLGRLNTPLFKPADSDQYQVLSWESAFERIAERMQATPAERSFFYSSGRSSNEAGFVLQLLARLSGTNNVSNCSYYCHQATGVGLQSTVGSYTATVELEDLVECDLVVLVGANPASNHPRLMHKLMALRERGGHVVVVNPAKESGLVKFAVPKSPRSMLKGGSEIASEYLQPTVGSDIWLLYGIAKSLLQQGLMDDAFIQAHTEGSDAFLTLVAALGWAEIEETTGVPQADIDRIAALYGRSEKAIFAWGMGVTHHTHGADTVEAIANLALCRGMVGKPGAGLLPLRGHSNVQGIGTIGVKPVLPEQVFQALEEELNVRLPTEPGLDTLASLEQAHAGEMDLAVMLGGNLLDATPDTRWAREALDRVKTKVFLTTTLNWGHVSGMENSEAFVLPVAARDEEFEPTTQESMFNFVRLSDGGIIRLDNVKSESSILLEMLKRGVRQPGLNLTSIESHQGVRECIARVIPGMAGLADISDSQREFHIPNRLIKTPEFATSSGKAHFQTHSLPDLARAAEFPFALMSVRSEGQFNSIIYEEADSYRGTPNRWSVLMSPQDMLEKGIKPQQKVTLRSPNGCMEAVEVYPYGLSRGAVMAYYPEANVLTGIERDPRSHTPAFKSVAVAIEV
ncbi:FdhF/YdeP family oxidoreductase [Oceanobacter sp. 4_MG-2023]|uniref:FdhF/YdeP family oxidoreductase n=1 Tax=Oceanobacter sp. 4_MG-2023 TaxID=3062623 RepID=UPI0027336EFD|nr:FdhF/YdeP family oxidoreductase [Oceanobacter sp. 4_MG-2023]MDP2549362.1 FdhF/YdeP family oxidoreductase [Oceanobacter sp. 4_MG-2023]